MYTFFIGQRRWCRSINNDSCLISPIYQPIIFHIKASPILCDSNFCANIFFFSVPTRKTCNIRRLLRGYRHSLETKKYQIFSMCIFNVIHDPIFLNRPIFALVRELSASLVLSCWRITLLRTVGSSENPGGGE